MIEIKGWLGKTTKLKSLLNVRKNHPETNYCFQLADTKGRKEEWAPEDWPPMKVKVTIQGDQ